MRRLPGRLRFVFARKGYDLSTLAVKNNTQKSVLSETIAGKRNTPRLIAILETNIGLPITTIRQIYKEDKNRNVSREETNLFLTKNNIGANHAASHN